MYTVDISIINFIICINNNYYRYIFDFNDEYVNKIKNKYGYLKYSILSNINKLKNNEIIWYNKLG